jgi:hypothetical protein
MKSAKPKRNMKAGKTKKAAVQIADRWRLSSNTTDAVERFLNSY